MKPCWEEAAPEQRIGGRREVIQEIGVGGVQTGAEGCEVGPGRSGPAESPPQMRNSCRCCANVKPASTASLQAEPGLGW